MAIMASKGIARPWTAVVVVVVGAVCGGGLEISELEDERRSAVALEEPGAFPCPDAEAAWTCEAEYILNHHPPKKP